MPIEERASQTDHHPRLLANETWIFTDGRARQSLQNWTKISLRTGGGPRAGDKLPAVAKLSLDGFRSPGQQTGIFCPGEIRQVTSLLILHCPFGHEPS